MPSREEGVLLLINHPLNTANIRHTQINSDRMEMAQRAVRYQLHARPFMRGGVK